MGTYGRTYSIGGLIAIVAIAGYVIISNSGGGRSETHCDDCGPDHLAHNEESEELTEEWVYHLTSATNTISDLEHLLSHNSEMRGYGPGRVECAGDTVLYTCKVESGGGAWADANITVAEDGKIESEDLFNRHG